MTKRLCLTLMAMILAMLSVHARYKGTEPVAGGQYYLLNVYQSKFLTTGNTLITDKQGTPAQYTATSATSITVNGTAYTIEKSDYGYMLKNGSNALMFNGGSYIHDDATGKDFLNVPNGGVGVHEDAANTNTKKDCAQWLFITADEYATMQAKKTFTTCALNVDGMPRQLSLNLIVYKKDFELNDDAKEGPGATAIGSKIRELGYDVIGLSEDFNFHQEIMDAVNNGSQMYTAGTHPQVLSQSTATLTNYTSSKPLFTTDGLGLLTRDAKASFSGENRTAWTEHYGYTDSGADGLITKGFRYYLITLEDGTQFDLYILHMDAEDSPGDNAAREVQMKQLADYIKASNNGRPIIVMGDTNCRYTRDPLKKKFVDAISADPRFTCKDVWIEHCRDGSYPAFGGGSITVGQQGYRRGEVVDKVFYINNTESNIRIVAEQFRQDISFVGEDGYPLADHWPMVTEFSYHDYDPAIDDVVEEPKIWLENVYLRNRATGWFLKQGGHYTTHAMQGIYGNPITIEQVGENGLCAVKTNVGNLIAGDPYMDNSDEQRWNIVKKDGYIILKSGTTALSGADGYIYDESKMQVNKRYVCTRDYNENDQYQQWEVLTEDQLLAAARYADESNPHNLTFMLPAANFDANTNPSSKWSINITSSSTRLKENIGWCGFHAGWNSDPNLTGDWSNMVGVAKVIACPADHSKSWNKNCSHGCNWKLEQSIKLPAGTYQISCQAIQYNEKYPGYQDLTYLFANGVEAQVPILNSNDQTAFAAAAEDGVGGGAKGNWVAKMFNNGDYKISVVATVGTDGVLTLGIEKKTGSSNPKDEAIWTYFDNFQIECIGVTPTAYEAAHATAVSKGTEHLAIASVLEEFPELKETEALDAGHNIETATAILNNAVAIVDAEGHAESLLTNGNFTATRMDIGAANKWALDGSGWTYNVVLTDETKTISDESVNKSIYAGDGVFHMWTNYAISYSELSQTLQNLPNGTYKVSADFKTWGSTYLTGEGSSSTDGRSWIGFFGHPGNSDKIVRTDHIVGDVSWEGNNDGDFHTYTFYVKVHNHLLTIGVRNDMTRYYMMKNVKIEMVNDADYESEVAKGYIYQDLCWQDHNALEYDLSAEKYAAAKDVDVITGGFVQRKYNVLIKAASKEQLTGFSYNIIVDGVCDNLVLTDQEPFSNSKETFTATNATYERTMANQWGTVMLPYDVQSNDEVKYYTLKNVSTGTEGVMTFELAETLAAGTPGVFVKQDESAESVEINGTNLTVATNSGNTNTLNINIDNAGEWQLIGTYSPLSLTDYSNLYYIASNKFFNATGALTVAPFRAYFKAPSSNSARSFRLVVDDNEATTIQLVPETDEVQEVYTLSGLRLNSSKNLKPGIYIINNKKTLVK